MFSRNETSRPLPLFLKKRKGRVHTRSPNPIKENLLHQASLAEIQKKFRKERGTKINHSGWMPSPFPKRNVFISTGMPIIHFPQKENFTCMENIGTRSATLWIAYLVYVNNATKSWLGPF